MDKDRLDREGKQASSSQKRAASRGAARREVNTMARRCRPCRVPPGSLLERGQARMEICDRQLIKEPLLYTDYISATRR